MSEHKRCPTSSSASHKSSLRYNSTHAIERSETSLLGGITYVALGYKITRDYDMKMNSNT